MAGQEGSGLNLLQAGFIPSILHSIVYYLSGADCDGCLIVEQRVGVADLICNSCGVVVDTVPVDRAGTRLMELASAEICSAQCPRCVSLNTFPGFSLIEAFICRKCREGVSVERPVQ